MERGVCGQRQVGRSDISTKWARKRVLVQEHVMQPTRLQGELSVPLFCGMVGLGRGAQMPVQAVYLCDARRFSAPPLLTGRAAGGKYPAKRPETRACGIADLQLPSHHYYRTGYHQSTVSDPTICHVTDGTS